MKIILVCFPVMSTSMLVNKMGSPQYEGLIQILVGDRCGDLFSLLYKRSFLVEE